MTQEQKARAYDEALERAQKATRAGSDVAMDIVQYIFPQLAEGEDEKIRKWIVKFLVEQYPECWKEKKNKMLAYLEKQKQKPLHWRRIEDATTQRTDDGCCVTSEKMLVKGWINDEDYRIVDEGTMVNRDILCIPVRELNAEQKSNFDIHWENGSMVCEQKEQKPAEKLFKEEYVKKFKALCDAYDIKLPNREYDIYGLCEDLHKLFGDIQKPAEWSEEDKNTLLMAATVLKANFDSDEKFEDCDYDCETLAGKLLEMRYRTFFD